MKCNTGLKQVKKHDTDNIYNLVQEGSLLRIEIPPRKVLSLHFILLLPYNGKLDLFDYGFVKILKGITHILVFVKFIKSLLSQAPSFYSHIKSF